MTGQNIKIERIFNTAMTTKSGKETGVELRLNLCNHNNNIKKMTVLERHGIIDVNKQKNSEVSIAHNE